MRALLQRVRRAAVVVNGQTTGAINQGLVILLGVGQGDGQAQLERLADKIVNLRIFNDEQDKFNLSLLDVDGGALVVSQFTLYADARKGRRPSFTDAAGPDIAEPLCDQFVQMLKQRGVQQIGAGVFGAHMDVEIHNDGPVTIWLDTAELM